MKYKIVTYGCQMNVHESEKLGGILSSRGFTEAESASDADIVLFNTCCIREGAENKAFANIGALKKLKSDKPDMIIGICGCMTQQTDAADRLYKKFPFVDIIFGTHNLHTFSELLDARIAGGRVYEIWEEGGINEDTPVRRENKQNAWVNIMYGCNNFCSYCIVPYVRGRERSRERRHIVEEVRGLIAEGYPEITLLGQNVNSYGDGKGFSGLLSEISLLEGNFRLKFMTSHPKDLSEDVIKVIASSDKIADYIHLPVQSGSSKILAAMNRKYTREIYLDKIAMIRSYIPHCGLSSDFIVGFPGETEEDFEKTMDLLSRVRFDTVFSFIYSRRRNTPADKMNDQIPLEIKRDRIHRLQALQDTISIETAQSLVGSTMRLLGERYESGILSAGSDTGRAVSFKAEDGNLVGKFFFGKITASKKSRLFGEVK